MECRILYTSATAGIGGAEVSLLGLLEHLDKNVFEPWVVVPAEGTLAQRLRAIGIRVIVSPLHKGSKKNPIPFLKSVGYLAWLIRKNNIDLVHANHEFTNRYAVLASRLARVPQICHVRNIQTPTWVKSYWLRWPPFLIANSQATARSYEPYLRPSQKSFVVYNGVDLTRFNGSRHSRERFGIPEDAYVIVQVGRITPEKGLHLFVEALSQIASVHSNIYGLIVGDTKVYGDAGYLQTLQEHVRQLELNNKINFTGYVGDIESVYGVADLLVQPSTAEPFGRTLIEAMAMSLPVVATRAGGAVEVVEDRATGLLVPPNDVSELAQAILGLMENRALAGQMGQAGRERAERLFAIQTHARHIQEIYQAILSR